MQNGVYQTVPVGPGCWRIEEGRPQGVRCLLFCGRDKALLVDTGFGTGDLHAEVRRLTDLPVMLVNTHADGDHLGCNHQFAQVHLHPAEYDRYAEKAKADSAPAPLWEGDVIDLGGRRFEVVLIPGHTPGSIALLDRENGVLVSGDSVQAGLIFMTGPGRNLPAFIASVEKLCAMRRHFSTVYPSHGDFPLEAGILDEVLDGARRLLAGELEGGPPPMDVPAKVYTAGRVNFLY